MVNSGETRDFYNKLVSRRKKFQDRNRYYYRQIASLLQSQISNLDRIIECGCGLGFLLNMLQASDKTGIEVAEKLGEEGKKLYPDINFINRAVEDTELTKKPDAIIMSDFLSELNDIQQTLLHIRILCHSKTKILITQHNYLWKPLLKLLEILRLKRPNLLQNYLPADDIENFLYLCDFRLEKKSKHILIPTFIPGISWLFNRIIAKIPIKAKEMQLGRDLMLQWEKS